MSRRIRFNAFDMNTVGHISAGLWRHPDDQAWRYRQLSYWTELAQLLEKGVFDGIFIADVLGTYDVYAGSHDGCRDQARLQVPVNDPLLLVSAMAAVTKHLGFGVTAGTAYEHPYPFARRMSTLDHLTEGRIGWNVVTGYLPVGARNMGHDDQVEHDARYDHRRRVPRGALQALGGLVGGRRRRARPRERRVHRPVEGALHRPQGNPLHGSGHPPERAVATAHPGDLPGRRVGARHRLRGRERRGHLRRRPHQGDPRASRSTPSATGSRARAELAMPHASTRC